MRNSRDRWVFFTSPARQTLTPDEVRYWKNTLGNILKVGMEFEFNLPERKGSCRGGSMTCPCVNMNKGDCWKKCDHLEVCSKTPSTTTCSKFGNGCAEKVCESCEDFTFKCLSTSCSGFVPACDSCDKFDVNCQGCDYRLDPAKDPESIRKKLHEMLKPTRTYGHLGPNGVHSIVQDGSLLGNKGAEVITSGRRANFWEFYRMSKKIIDETISRGGYVNERCSIHMHILNSYYGSVADTGGENVAGTFNAKITEMEKDMPEIVMANLHQLFRRYQNALTWMTMGLDDPDRMTRWEKFRVSVLEISAMADKMRGVSRQVEHNSGGNKYGFINYKYSDFAATGDINRLHVEVRVMDGLLSPSVVAAMACLYHAMVIKAVEISRYGVLEVGDDEWMANSLAAKNALLNNMKGYQDGDRWGDTTKVSQYRETYIRESLELVHQLKHNLIRLGPAYEVLEKLAERPLAYLRCEGRSWSEIEDMYKVDVDEEGQLDIHINEYIDLRIVDECQTPEEWTLEVVNNLNEEISVKGLGLSKGEVKAQVETFVHNKTTDGELIWSDRLGAMVKV